MATFKKFDNQQVFQLVTDSAIDANVGDVISYNTSSKEISIVDTHAEAIEQLGLEGKRLYLIAQSDAVTYGKGTGYKSHMLKGNEGHKDVYSAGGKDHIVVAYRIENLANIEGLQEA